MAGRMAGAAVSILLAAAGVRAGTYVQNATLEHGGITRYFDYYVPDGLPPAPVPLLLVLHGGTQSNKVVGFTAFIEFHTLADQEGFLVVHPNGTDPATGLSSPTGSFNWNDCRNDAGTSTTTADDVGFLGALVDWAAGSFAIDPDRVYATGASNGGLMSYRLALESSDRIAAIGAVVANLPANGECAAGPARPVGVLVMNGTVDPFMPFGGGTILGNTGVVQSTAATRDFWRGVLGTSPAGVPGAVPNVNFADGSTVGIDTYCNGGQGTAMALYTVTGGGHTMPSIAHPVPPSFSILGPQNRDLEGASAIWQFLRRHRRTACGPCQAWDAGTETCIAQPRTGCLHSTTPAKATLVMTDVAGTADDKMVWKWPRGEALASMDVGTPLGDDTYALCVYDESGPTPALLSRAVVPGALSACGAPGRWSVVRNGYKYKDPATAPDGMYTARFATGVFGKARVTVKATGANLSGRSFGVSTPPLTLPLRVQLHVAGGACVEATYSAAGVLRNEPGRFKGRADM